MHIGGDALCLQCRVQHASGVIDVLVQDEAEAVAVARQYLGYFQGALSRWDCADQRLLRHAIPENRLRVYDVRAVLPYTKNVLCCDIHTRERSRRRLLAAGAEKVLLLSDLMTAPVNGSGSRSCRALPSTPQKHRWSECQRSAKLAGSAPRNSRSAAKKSGSNGSGPPSDIDRPWVKIGMRVEIR